MAAINNLFHLVILVRMHHTTALILAITKLATPPLIMVVAPIAVVAVKHFTYKQKRPRFEGVLFGDVPNLGFFNMA